MDHAYTTRDHYSKASGTMQEKKLGLLGAGREGGALNRSADNISNQSDNEDLQNGAGGRVNATMPFADVENDEEGIDPSYFYEGSPNKAGLQSRRQMMNAANFSRKSINCIEDGGRSANTFIDSNHSELDTLKAMRMQNLTSIVNNPKRDTFLDKLGSAVKNKIDSKRNIHKKGYNNHQQ